MSRGEELNVVQNDLRHPSHCRVFLISSVVGDRQRRSHHLEDFKHLLTCQALRFHSGDTESLSFGLVYWLFLLHFFTSIFGFGVHHVRPHCPHPPHAGYMNTTKDRTRRTTVWSWMSTSQIKQLQGCDSQRSPRSPRSPRSIGKEDKGRGFDKRIRGNVVVEICCCLSCIICPPLAPCPLCLSCPMWPSQTPPNPGVKSTVNAPLLAPCGEARCLFVSAEIVDKMLR